MDNNAKITIDVAEYKSLLERDRWLSCLEMAGVDNWEGYGYARDFLICEDDE